LQIGVFPLKQKNISVAVVIIVIIRLAIVKIDIQGFGLYIFAFPLIRHGLIVQGLFIVDCGKSH
jgi:hypothetical protein